MKLLLIEDDEKTASFILKGLREESFTVDHAAEGHEGLDMALLGDYDAAILDIMLPGLDGLKVLETMRAEGKDTPVIILSAKRTVSDRIEGLRRGGDDYLVKPFSFTELLVRLQTLIRRTQPTSEHPQQESILRLADLELDPWKHEARRQGEPIPLHPREFSLLHLLLKTPDRVVSKTSILENVYEYNFDPQTNVVDVLVSRLRKKIDKGFEPKLLHTVRGMGYVLKTP